MPISRQEFESTLDRPAYLALEFLRSNIDAAYTANEIAEALAQEDIALSEPALERALAELVNRQWVEASTRQGKVYYSYRRWLGLRRR
jgi:hypothetical protein